MSEQVELSKKMAQIRKLYTLAYAWRSVDYPEDGHTDLSQMRATQEAEFDAALTERDEAVAGSAYERHVAECADTQGAWLLERDRLTAALEATSGDEHHTMDELYEYRMFYNAHAARGWLAEGVPVVKSWQHSDGEKCFGGGWFIVTAILPTGQVSNHYAAEHWDLFAVPEVDLPPEYDGHTPAVAAERLRNALIPPTEGAAHE